MSQKKLNNFWFSYGRKFGFGIGFDVSRWYISIDLGFWYIGAEW